jgi:hypothetical protein
MLGYYKTIIFFSNRANPLSINCLTEIHSSYKQVKGRKEERGKLVGAPMGNPLREFDVEQPLRGKNPLTPNNLTRV